MYTYNNIHYDAEKQLIEKIISYLYVVYDSNVDDDVYDEAIGSGMEVLSKSLEDLFHVQLTILKDDDPELFEDDLDAMIEFSACATQMTAQDISNRVGASHGFDGDDIITINFDIANH